VIPPGLLVAVGGVAGAILRHELALAVDREGVPLGTFTVNVLGSLALGFLTATGSETALLAVGTGACGAFTTFSSLSVETVSLWVDEGRPLAATLYAVGTLLAALVAVGIGWWLATR
jgi:CrcB protein